MPDFLADPSTTIYGILATLTFLTGIWAAKARKKLPVIVFAVSAISLVALFVIDKTNESPREQTVLRIKEMGSASKSKNINELMKNISESFSYKNLDKKALKAYAERATGFGFEGVDVWDAQRNEFKAIDASTVEQGFIVQPIGNPQFQRYCVGTFKKDPDGQWRLSGFKLYNPLQRTNAPEESVPGL